MICVLNSTQIKQCDRSFYTWPLEVAVKTYIKVLWRRIPNAVMLSNLVMQNIVR